MAGGVVSMMRCRWWALSLGESILIQGHVSIMLHSSRCEGVPPPLSANHERESVFQSERESHCESLSQRERPERFHKKLTPGPVSWSGTYILF